MEDRLKFRGDERVRKVQEIRRRNRRKRRILAGLLITLMIVLSMYLMDRSGLFDLLLNRNVAYAGNTEYVELKSEDGSVSRRDIVTLSQILINHPFMAGNDELVTGKPDGPIGSGGFVDWVYLNLTGAPLSAGSKEPGPASTKIWYSSTPVVESDLMPGDIGFSIIPEGSRVNHMGIYLGEIDGEKAFIHAGGISYRADGLPDGRVIISFNNVLKRNNRDMSGNRFSPAAPATRFVYYRRPNVKFRD